jgi:thioredoxin 1
MSAMKTVSMSTFEEDVRRAELPVVLDFWGPRCVPCVRLEPHVERLSDEFSGRVEIRKVVAPENRRLCIDLRVMSLPTIVAFAGGREVKRLSGEAEVSRESIRGLIEEVTTTTGGTA